MPQKSLDEIFGSTEPKNNLYSQTNTNQPRKSLDEIFGSNGSENFNESSFTGGVTQQGRKSLDEIFGSVEPKNLPEQTQKKGLLERTAGVFDNTFGKAGDLLFGTVARTAGDAIGMFGTGVKDLITGDYKKVGTPEYKKDVFSKDFEEMTSSPKKTIGNAASVVLEGLPFMGGGGVGVAGVGKKALTKIVPKIAEKSLKGSKYLKPFIEGSKYGGLYSAANSLKEEDPLLTTVKKTALGSVGGGLLGLGGVVVGQVGKSVKNTISPSIEAALVKAIKPKSNNTKFVESLKTALPDIQETAQKSGLKIENIDHLEEVVKKSKKGLWEQFKSLLGPNAKAEIDGNIIADRMIKGIDRRFITQNPEKYRKIVETANTYRRPISLDEAEEFLQSSNNELHSYYGKNKVQQAVAMADPEISHVVRESDALREELNKKLFELTGENAGAIKKRYGALSNLQAEIVPRKNVIARQNPISLGEQVSYGRGAANILKSAANFQLGDAAAGAADLATTRFLKLRNDPNELIKLAFQKLEKNPSTPYKKVMSKFVPYGYLPSPSYIPMPQKQTYDIGIVKNAPKPIDTSIQIRPDQQVFTGEIVENILPLSKSKNIKNNFKKTYQIINEGNKLKTVEGKPLKLIDGVETFIHKGDNPKRHIKGFVVSEKSTGRFLGSGETEKEAVDNAKNAINNVGTDRFLKLLKEKKLTN